MSFGFNVAIVTVYVNYSSYIVEWASATGIAHKGSRITMSPSKTLAGEDHERMA
jgi:hypothetical protein